MAVFNLNVQYYHMSNSKFFRAGRRKSITMILAKGLSRCVDKIDKSRYISNMEQNKVSRTVAYEVDIPQNKSVCEGHEN